MIGWGATALSIALGCGSEDDGITYRKSVRPLLQDRCTICHYSGGPVPADIENPFARGTGLVDALNTWAEPYPDENVDQERNVVPGNPAKSFLLRKLSDPALGQLPSNGHGGGYMPANFDPLTPEEIGKVEQWVLDGANDDEFFQAQVQPIFGYGDVVRPGKCSLCHYKDTPNPPNLIDPFDPVEGVVAIRSRSRPELLQVEPNNPDASFLVLKIRAGQNTGGGSVGNPMPYAYNPLKDFQIEVIAQWIREGALNN